MSDVINIKIKITDQASAPLEKAGKGVKGLGEEADKAKPKLSALDQIAVGALRKIGEAAMNMAASAGAAVLNFGQQTIAAAANFEDAMGDVAAISGATGEDFDRLRSTALALGADTAFSAGEAANGMKLLSQAGFSTNEVIAAMPGLLDAAAAGGVDLATATDVVANTLRGFGMAAGESGRVADVLALAANRSNTDITGLGEALKYAGPVAASMGMSLEDTTAAIGRMSDAGIKGSMAGTALRGILTRLAAPTEKAAGEMRRLGINVFDAQGKMLPMPELVAEVSGGLEGLTDSQKAHALSTIVGQEAMAGFLALINAGPENLAEFSGALEESGGAAQQMASVQLADFNGAMEALGGSVETFQITLGSRALPAMAAFVNDGLIPAVNAATELVDPVMSVVEALAGGLGPALLGVGVALTTYALVNAPAVLAANAALIASWGAQAAAVAMAVLPYAAIAAAVAGVAIAYNDFSKKAETATQKLLESRQWWNDSAAAIDTYNASLAGANPTIDSAAATVETLRSKIEESVESLGRRMAAGVVSDAQYQQEMATINMMRESLTLATGELNKQIEAIGAEAAASMTATSELANMQSGHEDLVPVVQLTLAEIEALGQQIQDTYQQGGQALQAFASTESEFLIGVEERRVAHEEAMAALIQEKEAAKTESQRTAIEERITAEQESYVTQETNAATAYAEQQAAQRAHLGTMLIDYTNAQVQLGNITAAKAAEITDILVEEYGIQEDSAATSFAAMAAAIDSYASSSSASADSLIGTLRDNEKAAVETEKAMTSMAKTYTAEAVANFIEKGGEAQDYADILKNIPSFVETVVNTKYTESGTAGGGGGGAAQAKALGGPVAARTPYLVGEQGPELFVPDSPGEIIPAGETAALMRQDVSGSVRVELSLRGELARMVEATVDRKLEMVARGAQNRKRMG